MKLGTGLITASLLLLALQTGLAASLSARDREGVKLSREWMQADFPPQRAENGRVIFQFGALLPTIVCAPLRLCDIALQPGEKVSQVSSGDTVRWKIAPATSGPESNQIIHVVVKPTEPNLDTNLVVTTNRRTYHLRLVSHKKDWMPHVAFEYPEDHAKAWQALQAEQQKQHQQQELLHVPDTGHLVDDLNFRYEIDGEGYWRPVRVFDDGKQVYIDLPAEAQYRDAPILLIHDQGENRLVNYRLQGTRFIVDGLFDEAHLVAGVDADQQKIVIRRTGTSGKSARSKRLRYRR